MIERRYDIYDVIINQIKHPWQKNISRLIKFLQTLEEDEEQIRSNEEFLIKIDYEITTLWDIKFYEIIIHLKNLELILYTRSPDALNKMSLSKSFSSLCRFDCIDYSWSKSTKLKS